MSNKGLNRLGKVVDSQGATLVEMFGPPNALTDDAGTLSRGLYTLSETIIRGILPESRGGGLGGDFGHGVDFDNDVFMMHQFCWCEKNDGSCLWCVHGDNPDFDRLLKEKWGTEDYQKYASRHYYDPPLFWHKASDFRVGWYKWIGRDTVSNRDITGEEWLRIFAECWNSLPQEARDRALAEHNYENTPEYLKKREEGMGRLWKVMKAMDNAMRPCFKCSMDENAFMVGGHTETGGGVKINTVYLDENGACTNCGHITTPEEHAQLTKRLKILRAAWRKSLGG